MQGGVVQGIGWALNEEYYYGEDGRMENASFLDYRMPTSLDLPMIDTIIVEVPNPGHPFGVRGGGRGADRAAAGGHRQRRPRCHRASLHGAAHLPATRGGGAPQPAVVRWRRFSYRRR